MTRQLMSWTPQLSRGGPSIILSVKPDQDPAESLSLIRAAPLFRQEVQVNLREVLLLDGGGLN